MNRTFAGNVVMRSVWHCLLMAGVVASSCAGFAQSGSMTLVSGLNTSNDPAPTTAPDPTIAVGTLQYCELVNSGYQCWWKSGANANQPVNFFGNTSPKYSLAPWSQNADNNGNTSHCPIGNSPNTQLIHDNVYNLWIMQRRTHVSGGHDYLCVAISNLEDVSKANFGWFGFEFDLDTVIPTNAQGDFYYPDYPQAGLWQSSTTTTAPYTAAKDQAMWLTYDLQDVDNSYNINAVLACAVDLAGLRASTSSPWVNNSKTPACVVTHPLTVFNRRRSYVPANNSDTTPPLPADGEMFTYMIEPAHDGHTYLTQTTHTQGVEQWTIDWTAATPTPVMVNSWDLPSTLSGGDQVACFVPASYYNTVCIPQPTSTTTGVYLDSIGDRMQQFFHYTSNGGLGSTWTSAHAIQITPGATTSQTEADWRVLQWNTATPAAIVVGADYQIKDPNDASAYVFMPSVARDKVGNLQGIVGVSGSKSAEHPGLESVYYLPGSSTLGSYGYIANPAADGDAQDVGDFHWGDWFGAVLDPSDSCTVWVVGEYLPSNRTAGPYWSTEIASLPPAPGCGNVATLSSTSLTFASQEIGTTSPLQILKLTNGQATAVSISSIVASGDFAETDNCGSTLAGNASCTIHVTFTPTALGTRTGKLTVTDNAANSPQTAGLTGTAIAQAVLLNPSSLTFPNTAVGSASPYESISVTNAGGSVLNISSVAATGNYSEADTCSGSSLQPSGSCTIRVTFSPTTVGAIAGAITLTDSAGSSPQTMGVTGSGILPVTLSSSLLSFGNVNVGSTSASHTMTVTNNTGSTVSLSLVASGLFAVAGNGSSPCGASLAAGKSCTAGVTFSPTVNGTTRGAVTVTTNAGFSPLVESLSGVGANGTTGPLTLSPVNVVFTNAVVGASTVTKTVTVTNSSSSSVTISALSVTGNYSLVTTKTPCTGAVLAAGGKCTLGVTFTPTIAGTLYGSILITDNGSIAKQVESLSSTAVWPVSLSPTSLTFAAQTAGTTSAAQVVTLTNNQSKALTLSSIAASGDFVVTSAGTSPCVTSVAALGQCTIGVEFHPTQTGSISGALSVSHSASNTPLEIGLTGTGQ